MFDIITFGSATRDIVIRPKQLTNLKYEKEPSSQEVCFPLGSKIDVEEIHFTSGGGGTNSAATFANQGLKVAFCGAIGDDLSGLEVLKELKNLRIDARFVVKRREKATNHSIVILNSALERTILAYRGAAELVTKNDIPWRKLKAKWLYIAPLSGLLCDIFSDLVDFAKQNHMKVAVNPGIAQLSLPNFAEIAKNIDVLLMNEEEASFLTKIPVQNLGQLFTKIDEMCPGIAVMTRGGEGVVVSDGEYLYTAKPNMERKIVDTTGAGDAFGSGFVAEYMKTNNIEKAIQFAMANSVGGISEIGAKTGLLKKGQQFDPVSVVKQKCDNNVCIVK